MSELLVQDTSLTTVADAIREKADITGKLTFPNGFADAIRSLSRGANVDCITDIVSGTYTPTKDITNTVGIAHGMDVTPNFVFLFNEGEIDYSSTKNIINVCISYQYFITHSGNVADGDQAAHYNERTIHIGCVDDYYNYSALREQDWEVDVWGGIDDKKFYFRCSDEHFLKSGQTYRWIAANISGLV